MNANDLTEIEAAIILVPYIGACYGESGQREITQEFIEQIIKIAASSYDYNTRMAGVAQPHWTTILHAMRFIQSARVSLAERTMLN